MHRFTKPYLIITFSVFLLTGCSTSNLQGGRLDTAEEHLKQAELAIQDTKHQKVGLADSNLGVASAYLLTLRDFKKRLTASEKKRYLALLQREKTLTNKIHALKK